MKIRVFFCILTLFISLFFISSVNAAVINCADCHHIDFETPPLLRNGQCWVCHGTGDHSPPHIYEFGIGYFNSLATLNSTDITFIHNSHNGYNMQANSIGCKQCHQKVACKSCHYSVGHETHGNASHTGSYADGSTYSSKTFSCAASECHLSYAGGILFPSLGGSPDCLNCHTDPHGSPPGTDDEAGVTIQPNGANPATHSDISIKWKYLAGDTFKKSLDGINWTAIGIGSPPPGEYFTYTDPGILNWTVIYYKIIRSGGSERYFPVFPPGSNAHTNYLDNTVFCASCHVTHAAEQARLLKEQTIEDLCRTCHGLASTGSRYNVDTGEIVVAGTINGSGLITATSYIRSNSGAFGILSGGKYYAGNHSGTWNGAEVTSTHRINSSVTGIAPGGGDNNIRLTCTSCHSSHPKKNAYRLLNIGTVEAYAYNPAAVDEKVNYIKNMNVGCGCHRQYIVDQNSGHSPAGTYYRHAVGVAIRGSYASTNPITGFPWALTTTLPTEYMVYYNNAYRTAGSLAGAAPAQYTENGAVFCLTCHYAHGTTATGVSASAYDLNEDTIFNDTSTMLKRKNNDGLCQDCHKR